MISFSRPAQFQSELAYVASAIETGATWGGGRFYEKSTEKLATLHRSRATLLTQSCTSALELAAIALNVGPGDEVIVPSYTFVSSANAFALRGAKLVFVDSRPSDMNIDADLIESKISEKTKAIVVVHYGGVACDMSKIMGISRRYGVPVVEDAAQGIGSSFEGQALGTIGDLGCLSFHGTKNVSSGEGGALLINTDSMEVVERALTAHEKGTDRASFLRGEVDKYTWRSLGSSFIPSEFTCAVLLAQLDNLEVIQMRRQEYYSKYQTDLAELTSLGFRELTQDVEGGNFHMFALVAPSHETRESLRQQLKQSGIIATSHYEPLHESPFILETQGEQAALPVASELSRRLLRLPMWSADGLDTSAVTSRIRQILR